MRVTLRPSRFSLGGPPWQWQPGFAILRQRNWLFGLLFLVVPASGCNSGTGDSDTPHPLARVESAAEGGAFRNLGKRSTFDYGSVEPRRLERNPVGDTRTTLGN
jgi:hypothetical protein